jgi:hypothetical protein
MPIEYLIDHVHRLVRATGRGTLSGNDIFAYQREVWSRPDVVGYNELMDMTDVGRIHLEAGAESGERLRQLAGLAASMDREGPSTKFAIVAPSDEAFGLGRMYEAYRRLEDRSLKQVGVFRSMDEARAFLGLAP